MQGKIPLSASPASLKPSSYVPVRSPTPHQFSYSYPITMLKAMAEGSSVKPSRLHTLLVKRVPGYSSFFLVGTVGGRPKKQSLS